MVGGKVLRLRQLWVINQAIRLTSAGLVFRVWSIIYERRVQLEVRERAPRRDVIRPKVSVEKGGFLGLNVVDVRHPVDIPAVRLHMMIERREEEEVSTRTKVTVLNTNWRCSSSLDGRSRDWND